jgi:uncharacterized protein (DUF427 family)
MNDHIKTHPAKGTWVARAGGAILAETTKAVALTEGEMPTMIYFPQDDIAMEFFEKSDKSSYCPHKGTASYFGIQTKSGLLADAAWCYEEPFEVASDVAGCVAFYPNVVVVEQI